ncbi:MAG TPA: DNA polymerase [Terracidiphilus sp.]|nr:DNA polymerase [Terracidiphilus sp.]
MNNEARQALRLRLAGAKSSIKKLPKILELLSPDDRLRFQYSFYKAHTGRWAGRGAQLQNLKAARTKEEKAMVAAVLKMLEEGRAVLDLDALSLALRPLLMAPEGKKIVLADFKSVENRVLAWASGCEAMMQVYREGRDPYIDFASRMEGCDYSDVTVEMRQQAKPATLGAGFGLGGGQLIRKCKCACKYVWNVKPEVTETVCPCCGKDVLPGMPQKTGLWRYAEMMGIDLSQERAQAQVDAFRETFMEVAQWWYYLEEAYAGACLKRRNQYIESSLGCKLVVRWQDPALRIVLPSGRELVYPNAYARTERTPRGGKKLILGYETERGNWGVVHTYGGRICENIVQAIARDCLVDAMIAVEDEEPKDGMVTIGHTHDELLNEANESDVTALDRLIGYMSRTPVWAPGLILAADGHEGKRYEK